MKVNVIKCLKEIRPYMSVDVSLPSFSLAALSFLILRDRTVKYPIDGLLRKAASRGDCPMIGFLIREGADVNSHGGAPLYLAAYNGHEGCVRFLIQRGAHVNMRHLLGNPSMFLHDFFESLAPMEKKEMVNKCNVAKCLWDVMGCIPPFYLSLEAISLSFPDGTYTDDEIVDALICLVDDCYEPVTRYLIDNGANVHAADEYPLRYAIENGHESIVKYLIKKEANIHVQNGDVLIYAADHGLETIVRYLVENGADVHAQDDSALQYAAENGDESIMQYLVENGADIHAEDERALYVAARSGHESVVRYLVEKGADVHAKNDRALCIAAEYGNDPVVKYLVEMGANIHTNDNGPLRMAAKNEHRSTALYLIEKGANIDQVITMTRKDGYKSIARFLEGIFFDSSCHW